MEQPWLNGAAFLALTFGLAAVGCGGEDLVSVETQGQPITDIDQSSIKRQSIGNCWLYAVGGWAESLHRAAQGTEVNLSETYWTYFHWFGQIEGSDSSLEEVNTGGNWEVGVDLIARYGWMNEADFIPGEELREMSTRQRDAELAINASLSTGALSTDASRLDRTLIKQELDRVFGLSAAIAQDLTAVFGAELDWTLAHYANRLPAGTKVHRGRELSARLKDPATEQWSVGNLEDVIGARASWGRRTGPNAWRSVSYPTSVSGRRNILKRVQRALHDRQPVVISWYVDFNALDESGRFREPPEKPGRQGGHLVVLEDYEIENVPGFGTLSAGVLETRPKALEAALDSNATITFWRIKNSWGSYRADRPFVLPGYHDLYMDYLNGPIQRCAQVDDASDPDNCWDSTPLWGFTLPAGY